MEILYTSVLWLISSQLCIQRQRTGRLKLGILGIFTLWESTNTTNQFVSFSGELVAKYLLAPYSFLIIHVFEGL